MDFRMKQLVDEPNKAVTDFIEGLAENYPGLQYLDGSPHVKIVLSANVSATSNDKVAVISDVIMTDFIEGLAENYPGLQYLDGFPQVKAVLCADVSATSNDKVAVISEVVTDFIEGLAENYPGLQYLDGFPQVKVVLIADVSARSSDKVLVISESTSGGGKMKNKSSGNKRLNTAAAPTQNSNRNKKFTVAAAAAPTKQKWSKSFHVPRHEFYKAGLKSKNEKMELLDEVDIFEDHQEYYVPAAAPILAEFVPPALRMLSDYF